MFALLRLFACCFRAQGQAVDDEDEDEDESDESDDSDDSGGYDSEDDRRNRAGDSSELVWRRAW